MRFSFPYREIREIREAGGKEKVGKERVIIIIIIILILIILPRQEQ